MPEEIMGTQIKAFGLLLAMLLLVDAFAWRGEYRIRTVHGIASFTSSVHGLGPGRDWSRPKPQRND
jgi:hypothetical protein